MKLVSKTRNKTKQKDLNLVSDCEDVGRHRAERLAHVHLDGRRGVQFRNLVIRIDGDLKHQKK
jgi:hypothetical protein